MADKNHAEETKDEADRERKNEDLNELPPKNQNNQPKPNVCRRLDFGVNTKEEMDDVAFLADDYLKEHRQKALEKWNFDFENEVPLEGDWEWERIPAQHPETKEVVCSMEKKHHDNRTV